MDEPESLLSEEEIDDLREEFQPEHGDYTLWIARRIERLVREKVAQQIEAMVETGESVDTGRLWRNGTCLYIAEKVRGTKGGRT